jgi:hypothetical protein
VADTQIEKDDLLKLWSILNKWNAGDCPCSCDDCAELHQHLDHIAEKYPDGIVIWREALTS